MSRCLLALLVLVLAAPAFAQPPPDPPPAGAVPPPPPPPAGDPNAAPPPPPPPGGGQPAAQPGQGPRIYVETPPPPEAVMRGETARHHGGFYLRLGLGLSLLLIERQGSIEGNLVSPDPLDADSSIRGVAGVFDFALGGTVGSGVVIGGMLLLHSLNAAELEHEDGSTEDLGGPLGFWVLAAFVDWFPDVRGGFHFGGGLGLAAAVAEAPEVSPFENIGGGGAAISVHLGYDFWIASEWSLGGMLRWTGASLAGESTIDTAAGQLTGSEQDQVSSLALTFTALYH